MEKGLVFYCFNLLYKVYSCLFFKCVFLYSYRKVCFQYYRKSFYDYSRNKVCFYQCFRCRFFVKVWESDLESFIFESGRNVSIKVVYGSCSSTDSF